MKLSLPTKVVTFKLWRGEFLIWVFFFGVDDGEDTKFVYRGLF